MFELPPIFTLPGSDEHVITGGCGAFTVKLALQLAKPFLVPSVKLSLIVYILGCKPVVSICVEGPVPLIFTLAALHLYVIVRLGLKLDPFAVAVTGSPAKTVDGSTEQEALGGIEGVSPPNMKTTPACALPPLISVLGVVALGPNR